MSTPHSSGRVVIAGGSGFLGTSLTTYLSDRGVDVVVLSRKAATIAGRWRTAQWDARTLGPWAGELDGATGLVNLTGRTVDCIKTPDHQDEILRSRVESTRVLGEAMRRVAAPPPVWVQMSTAHIYGDPPTVRCTEDSPYGVGLAPIVGQAWERAFAESVLPTQRGVVLRTSFVIGRDRGAGGGALSRLRFLARLGLGGSVGSGRQGMSWLHEQDMNRIVGQALETSPPSPSGAPPMQGVYIVSSPNPVPQREFMRSLRRATGMPIGLPAPAWLVRLGAPLVMRTDPELALYGRFVLPKRLLNAGFRFDFPELGAALRDLIGRA
jgi:uncharacterized protein (TIGR01777 family)